MVHGARLLTAHAPLCEGSGSGGQLLICISPRRLHFIAIRASVATCQKVVGNIVADGVASPPYLSHRYVDQPSVLAGDVPGFIGRHHSRPVNGVSIFSEGESIALGEADGVSSFDRVGRAHVLFGSLFCSTPRQCHTPLDCQRTKSRRAKKGVGSSGVHLSHGVPICPVKCAETQINPTIRPVVA